MGMAASQVRLLALTDRLHDVELKAQQILAQKLALGTQKDTLYNTYCDKLEATNYMVAFNDEGTNKYVDATYENLCTYNPARVRKYSLVDNRTGNVLVSKKEAELYEQYDNDKYAFAWAMMGYDESGTAATGGANSATLIGLNTAGSFDEDGSTYLGGVAAEGAGELTETELRILDAAAINNEDLKTALEKYNKLLEYGAGATELLQNLLEEFGYDSELSYEQAINNEANAIREAYAETANKALTTNKGHSILNGGGNDVLMTEAEFRAFLTLSPGEQESLKGLIDHIYDKDCKDPEGALETFREQLYANMNFVKQLNVELGSINGKNDIEFNNVEFEFYVSRWEAIDATGGCQVVDPTYENGEQGREWLENMVKAGLVTIQEYVNNEWQDTSVATSTNGNLLMEVSDDKGLKQAEAEYEHELDIIDRKETKMDNELAKLETERKSITTEIDSLKSVKDDNIDRTFGIFG